ncbi:hypothetical protein [Nocardioides sp. NPDC047086]|uniref:hypothetical protein n=1 Tax=Nocardioides sp. NPDC047086 TaxID=3154810 RepID=UPI0033D44BFF
MVAMFAATSSLDKLHSFDLGISNTTIAEVAYEAHSTSVLVLGPCGLSGLFDGYQRMSTSVENPA